jgi:hypothetical protein
MLVLLVFVLFSARGFAEEVDDFTPPPKTPRDATEVIDLTTNALLDELTELLNKSNLPGCNSSLKYTLSLKKLDQNFTAIGNGLRAGPEIALLLERINNDPARRTVHQQRLKEVQQTWLAEFAPEKRDWFAKLFSSVDYFGPRENPGSIYDQLNYLTCCTARINVNGIYFGLDKVDHFFGNAGLLFEQYLAMKSTVTTEEERLRILMESNVRQEHTLWGLKGLSPKSYGDLAANWIGLLFYRQLFDEKPTFISCRDSVFSRTPETTFHIRDYVDESWNESSNCSSFVNDRDLKMFQSNLQKAGTQCPRDPKICAKLVDKHQNDPLFVRYALSPLCNGMNSQFIPIEKSIPIDWSEVELSFRGFTWPIVKEIALKVGADLMQSWLPTFLKEPLILEGQRIFTQLRSCSNYRDNEQITCLRQLTEPELSSEQLRKFTFLLSRDLDISPLENCPKQNERLEELLHPQPIGDISLCFKTRYRQAGNPLPQTGESLGRVYFRRYLTGLKVVLLRF